MSITELIRFFIQKIFPYLLLAGSLAARMAIIYLTSGSVLSCKEFKLAHNIGDLAAYFLLRYIPLIFGVINDVATFYYPDTFLSTLTFFILVVMSAMHNWPLFTFELVRRVVAMPKPKPRFLEEKAKFRYLAGKMEKREKESDVLAEIEYIELDEEEMVPKLETSLVSPHGESPEETNREVPESHQEALNNDPADILK